MKPENFPRLLAVVGRPIFHSLSPEFYNLAFRLQKINACYVRLAGQQLEEVLATVRELKMAGFNLTSPYKEKILPHLDEVEEPATSISAVNTVIHQKNKLIGFNTDPEGFRLAAANASINLTSGRIIVLGAGGAARAVLYVLKQMGVGEVWITNRSEKKGKELAAAFGYSFVSSAEFKKKLNCFSLIVSCLPRTDYLLSYSEIPRGCRLIEAGYLPLDEVFPSGRKTSLEWLLGQAIASFRLFTGKELSPQEIKILRANIFRSRPKKKNLVLVGFMGCGKTAVARLLAAKWGWDFVDTDELIEKQTGQTIPEIFARHGEEEFRKIERLLIPDILLRREKKVVALGGGALKSKEIRQAMAASCYVVWLWTPLEVCLQRVSRDKNFRPLLTLNPSITSREKLLRERIPLYARSSDLLVANLEGRLEQTARLIHEEISPSL
ncbi:MAG: shikimate kinase [Candidatus Aminicenantales bacterium]